MVPSTGVVHGGDHDHGGQLRSVAVVCEVSAAVETAFIAKAVGGAGLIGIEIHLG
jgi:hypothetical protein